MGLKTARGLWLVMLALALPPVGAGPTLAEAPRRVYVLPIHDDIMPPLVYLVRRGVKEAMDGHADLLVLDMDTNGGRVDVTEQIIEIIGRFKGQTVTYVNRKAFSAGAFISVATQKIFMAPEGVIGAAAPILMMPGAAPEQMPATVEAKMTSGIKALVRATARKNGHNTDVIEAMIDKNKELKIGDDVLNEKGQILTLTSEEAARKYGNPPKPLLSEGTFDTLDGVLAQLGYSGATRVNIEPTGAETVATWINAISPLLLLIGIAGIYLEFKTPGVTLPGIVGAIALALYFFGGYVAGLSDWVWALIFALGLVLLIVEFFVTTGMLVIGLTGMALMLVALIMAMVDTYPGMPALPTLAQLQTPILNLALALAGGLALAWMLRRWLPRTPLYASLVSRGASGTVSIAAREELQSSRLGQTGVTISVLRPGGKAQFGDAILDVISEGELVAPGQRVRIIGYSGAAAVVQAVE